jgi:hypothetical protein
LHETTSQWKTYGKRLLSEDLEVRDVGQAQKKRKHNYQHYNILSAYEVKDETSTSSTYVSLVFYRMVRFRKILVNK